MIDEGINGIKSDLDDREWHGWENFAALWRCARMGVGIRKVSIGLVFWALGVKICCILIFYVDMRNSRRANAMLMRLYDASFHDSLSPRNHS